MNFIEKRIAKRRAKYGFILAYSSMGLLMVLFILWVVLNFKEENTSVISNALIGYSALVAIITMITFAVIGQMNLNRRWRYQRSIRNWRNYTFFNRCLTGLLEGNLDDAVEYHNDKLLKNKYLRDFLWGFGIRTFLTSDDDKKKEFAEQVISNLQRDFDPDNIFN